MVALKRDSKLPHRVAGPEPDDLVLVIYTHGDLVRIAHDLCSSYVKFDLPEHAGHIGTDGAGNVGLLPRAAREAHRGPDK